MPDDPNSGPHYLCIETNYNQDKLEPSPNFGFPFCVSVNDNPNYIRMLGPFDIFDEDKNGNPTLKNCEDYNISPYYIDENGKKINTTKGWYAVCQFNKKEKVGVSIELDYPPIRTMYPAAMGPFDTKELADAAAAEYITPKCLRKYQEAADVCSPNPIRSGNIDLCCSLLGSALNWPMAGGTLQLMFTPALCDDADASNRMQATYNKLYNKCAPMFQISLGCKPSLDPIIQTCWTGVSAWTDIGTTFGEFDPDENVNNQLPRGYTIRFVATMCVTSLTTVSIDVNMQWLMNPYDIDPVHPPQDPAISSCGAFSATLNLLGSPTKHQNRLYTSHEGYGDTFKDKPIKFQTPCSYLQKCFGSVIPLVVLMPQEFGCNGIAAEGPLTLHRCSLDDDDTSMACLQALIEPLEPLQDVERKFVNITHAIGDGEFVTYTCVSHNFDAGQIISIDGLNTISGESLNLTNVKIYSVNLHEIIVKDSTIGEGDNSGSDEYGNPNIPNIVREFWNPIFFSLGINKNTIRSPESGEIQTQGQTGCMYVDKFGGYLRFDPDANFGNLFPFEIAYANYSFTYTDPTGGKITISDRDSGIAQQIQLGSAAGFIFFIKRLIYEVPDPKDKELKITKYSPLITGIGKRKKGSFIKWEIANPEIIQTIGPWMAKCTFPKNNAVVHLYGFSFPPPILEECPGGYATTTPAPFLSIGPPNVESLSGTEKNDYINTLQAQLEKASKICIYRGNAIPNTKACCGASPSFECEKHGRCKQYGIAGPQDNMVCSSCPDFS